MKNSILFLAVLFLTFSSYAQDRLQKLDKTKLETNILVPASPLFNLSDFQNNTNSAYSFKQAYKLVMQNDFNNRYSNFNSPEVNRISISGSIPFAIFHSEYETIKPEAFTDGRISLDSQQNLIDNSINSSIYSKNSLSISAPLVTNHKGLNVTYSVLEDNIYNITNDVITKIEIDFSDGHGFRTISVGNTVSVTYNIAGNKTLKTKITLDNGVTKQSLSTLKISYNTNDLNAKFNLAVTTFQSTIAPDLSGYGLNNDIGTGEYDIFLSADNILDKPIFVIDGFDPGDTRDILSIYDLLNFDDNGTILNLGDQMRDEGFDIVVLNFPIYTRVSDNMMIDGGADFIERKLYGKPKPRSRYKVMD